MTRQQILLRRIQFLTWLFMLGLVLSGATAIPLASEVDFLVKFTDAQRLVAQASVAAEAPAWAFWLTRVQAALSEVTVTCPFLFYGTDWLAFGHFVIALAFIGPLRDPVRNCWLFTFGMIACALVIPYALVLGGVRRIPFWWRFVDCSFGVFGLIPLYFCHRWTGELGRFSPQLRSKSA